MLIYQIKNLQHFIKSLQMRYGNFPNIISHLARITVIVHAQKAISYRNTTPKKYENGQTKTFYYTQSKICKNCPDHDECCKSSNVRIITHFGGDLAKEMFLKMESEKGKEIYKPRFSKAESPFALGKEYLNMRQARARGVLQMDLQSKLTTIASNIIKINKYIWENKINNNFPKLFFKSMK